MPARLAPPEFWRSPRLKRQLPDQEIVIPDPPPEPASNGNALWLSLLPMGLMVVVMVMVSMASGANTMLLFSVPMLLASGLASILIYQVQKRNGQRERADRDRRYRALLQEYDGSLDQLMAEQHALRNANDPEPVECLRWVTALNRNLWARTPGDEDFLAVRLGLGQLPSTLTVKTPSVRDVLNPDPLISAAIEVARRHAEIVGVPICLNLRSAQVTGIGGERNAALATAHAVAVQLATHHAPTEVKLAAIYPAGEQPLWEWLRWLPHTWHDDRKARWLAANQPQTRSLLARLDDFMDERRREAVEQSMGQKKEWSSVLVVFLADLDVIERDPVVQRIEFEGPSLGLFPIFLGGRTKMLPASCRAVVKLSNGQASLIRPGAATSQQQLSPDGLDAVLLDQFARAIAPIRLKQLAGRSIPTMVSLLAMLGVEQVEALQIERRWQESQSAGHTLSVPIGLGAGRETLDLDLHERADGPNGLVAGTVGAGKSELLQTLVAALAINYHPYRLAFVLVDYKGGGMAKPFKELPHTLGVITNLDQENLALRALTSFNVELKRRQTLFDAAKVNHIDDYQRKYYAHELDNEMGEAIPLPYLVVIVDEFAEMKTEQPETAKEFVRIARVGRALGLRLILAMQRPAGIVDGQIEANTRFRLCLRVAQTEDSQAMLKRPDAAFLSGMGRAYLQVGANEKFKEFQVAWGGAPYDPQRAALGNPLEIVAIEVDGERHSLYAPDILAERKQQTQLDAVVEEIQATAQMQHITRLPSLWLEPLPEQLALADVRRQEGWDGSSWQPPATWLSPVVGRVDIPQEKRQQPLELNLGKEGHLAVYSAPGYGKTTFLQTLILSLALSHSPDDVQFYVLDFGSRLLKLFEKLPHTGGVITPDESERMERLFLLLQRKLDERRMLFSTVAAGSLASYRQITGRKEPAIVVILDNYANFLEAAGDDESAPNFIGRLTREGGALGIHLVVTANNSTAIRFSTASNIMLAVALHLVEQSEYGSIVGRSQDLKPLAAPGRGLVRGTPPLECQIALPTSGGSDSERVQALQRLLDAMAAAWQGRRPKPVSMLGETVRLSDVQMAELPLQLNAVANGANGARAAGGATTGDATMAALGLHVDDLTRFALSLAAGPHFLITGPARSGKSTLLRTWASSLAAGADAQILRLFVLDSRRQSLYSLRTLPQVAGYSSEPGAAGKVLERIEAELNHLPAQPGVSATGRGPTIVVIADDFGDNYDDGLADAERDQLGALMRLGRNCAFHVLLAGRASDVNSKSFVDPMKSLKEAQVGFMLGSGDDLVLNTRLPYAERSKLLPAGEGYYVNRTYTRRVKVAVADSELQADAV